MDTETLRHVLRFCSVNLEIAERFYDAATVLVLEQIVAIIEQGGVIDADSCSECDCERLRR